MLARQAALLTPTRSSHPRRLLSCQHVAHANPLAATLMHLPASVANKRLTVELSPLAATLTKNRGWGQSGSDSPLYGAFNPDLPSSVRSSKFRITQVLCFPLLRKQWGCGGFFPFRNSSLAPRDSSIATIPNSLRKTRGVGEHFVD